MRAFKDGAGREWRVEIDVPAMKAVRDATGVNLYKVAEGGLKAIAEVLGDPLQLGDVLVVLLREQLARAGVPEPEFLRQLFGDAVEEGAEAALEAVLDFFPKARQKALRELMQKNRRATERLRERAQAALTAADPEKLGDEAFDALLAQQGVRDAPGGASPRPTPSGSPGSASASSAAATPAAGASASS